MFPPPPTRFDPFIQAVARKAENIYTKMAIRRDESQDMGRRKKSEQEAEAKSIQWEDTTDVSVIALQGFLEDLLGLSHSHQDIEQPLPLTPVTVGQQPSPPRTAALHAANAYRSTGRAVHDENVAFVQPAPIIPSTPPPETKVRLSDDFGDAEREVMTGYLRDLGDLERRGVQFLTLRRSLTFLESIDQAIKAAI